MFLSNLTASPTPWPNMPFLYDVWIVKLQLYAKGLVWSRGGGGEGESTSVKLFSIFYMLNSKNGVFNPYFSIGTCPMRKRLLWISRGLNLLSFHSKNIIYFETFLCPRSFVTWKIGPLSHLNNFHVFPRDNIHKPFTLYITQSLNI